MIWRIVLAVVVTVATLILIVGVARADPDPVAPSQPRTDVFSCGALPCDVYDALTQKLKVAAQLTWAYADNVNCPNRGPVWDNTLAMWGNVISETGIAVNYNPSNPDIVIRVTCGIEFSKYCQGVGVIGCLGDGFPYNVTVTVTTDMGVWAAITQISILIHEVFGHAMQAANEQYCRGVNDPVPGCTGLFAPTPGWLDVMNTGPDSRHLIGYIERNRWGRIMGVPAPVEYGVGTNPDGSVFLYWSNWDLRCDVNECRGLSKRFPGYTSSSVSLFAWNPQTGEYRYLGVTFPSNGADWQGAIISGLYAPGEVICFDRGNAVDWQRYEYRSDRCVA